MDAEKIKNDLIRLFAERKVDDDTAGSTRDLWNADEMQEVIINILKEAGFQDVDDDLEREIAAVEAELYPDEDDE